MLVRRFWPALLAAGALLGLLGDGAGPVAAQGARHVVMISLDGFGADNLDDPRLPLPNLRRLAAAGAVAKRMTVVTPSVTWPNHTTLVTGVAPAKHGVLANGLIETTVGERPYFINSRRSKEEMCRFPTLYDLARAAGLKTGEVNWPVTRGAPTLDWSLPDHPDPLRNSTLSLLQELGAAGVLQDLTDRAFSDLGPLARDEVWTRTAVHLIRRHRPNLLLLHLLHTDGTQHAYGPANNEARTALALADRYVGDVVDALAAAGLREQSAVFVVSDHGFMRVEKQIQPNVRLRRAGLVRPGDAGDDRLQWEAQSIAEGGVALVYVPNGRLQPELIGETRRALEGLEGVSEVMDPSIYASLGLPQPNRSPQAPAFLLAAKEGYSFGNAVDGPEIVTLARPNGTHGYPHTMRQMDAILVAAGAGIRRGARLERARSVDVAPTIARLLGVTTRDTDGQALDAFLGAGKER